MTNLVLSAAINFFWPSAPHEAVFSNLDQEFYDVGELIKMSKPGNAYWQSGEGQKMGPGGFPRKLLVMNIAFVITMVSMMNTTCQKQGLGIASGRVAGAGQWRSVHQSSYICPNIRNNLAFAFFSDSSIILYKKFCYWPTDKPIPVHPPTNNTTVLHPLKMAFFFFRFPNERIHVVLTGSMYV